MCRSTGKTSRRFAGCNALISDVGNLYGRFEDFLAQREPSFGARIAAMNRVDAARFANACLVSMLRESDD